MTSITRLTRAQACKYLREKHGVERKPSTLAVYAVKGGGPAYQKDGRTPLYTPEALDEWVAGYLSPPVTSSAELKALKQAAA